MLFKKDRKIANQQAMLENRDKLIKDMQARISMQKRTKEELELKCNIQEKLLTEIAKLTITYPLDSERIILGKIKELVRPYHRNN